MKKVAKSKKKFNRGITLIALVVTIVVLLILAGVSISMLTGENGIITQAVEAKDKNKKAEIEEKVKLAVQATYTDSLGQGIEKNKFQEELDTNFGSGIASLDYDGTNQMYTVTVEDYEVEVSNKGLVGEVKKSSISIKLTLSSSNTTLDASALPNVSEVTSENVPIPAGFYYVGGTKNAGVVISDVEGDTLDNTAKGNQFVCVPVEQNQKLTLDVTSKENITGIKLTGPDGTETTLTASGKTFSQEITMTKNGVYTVEVSTATTTKTAQKRITSLYAQDPETGVIFSTNIIKNNITERYSTTQELLIAKSSLSLEELLTNAGVSSVGEYIINNHIFVDDQEEEFKKFVRLAIESSYIDNNQSTESVNKYGGFYIARYEAGDGTTGSARTSSTADTNTLVSKKGAYVYNYVDWETSITLSSGMYNTNAAVTSQLITGAGWDRTLNWIIEPGSKTENEVIIDSSSWGNYSNSTGNATEYSGSSNMNYTTGRNEYWKANNIYDLAGNVEEWTQEQTGTSSIYRGGNFYSYGNNESASTRCNSDPTFQNDDVSFRVQLYINI